MVIAIVPEVAIVAIDAPIIALVAIRRLPSLDAARPSRVVSRVGARSGPIVRTIPVLSPRARVLSRLWTLFERAAAIAAIGTARLDVTTARSRLAAILMPAAMSLRERNARDYQRRRHYPKELCHTSTAWLTNSLKRVNELPFGPAGAKQLVNG